MLKPLSPKTELRLRWEASLERIYWSLQTTENPLSKKEMINVLTKEQKKRLSRYKQEIVKYKKALTYISQEWLANQKPVTSKHIILLHNIAYSGRVRSTEKAIEEILDYLQKTLENPIIQAAIAYFFLLNLAPFAQGNVQTACLVSYLFLYKYGYNFRDLLVLEEYLQRNKEEFNFMLESTSQRGNITLWLEFFTKGIAIQVEKAVNDMFSGLFKTDLANSIWELNERQKEILAMLEQPGAKITNKKAQRVCKISQITASRDLAKLTSVGLLFSHGKGRSVYYTRV